VPSIFGTITLGELIDGLAAIPGDAFVQFDFAGFAPQDFMSYRGYYDQLALRPAEDSVTAADLLERARIALSESFTGYKGGTYRMDRGTAVWADQYGNASGTKIIRMKVHEDAGGKKYGATLVTRWEGEDEE
jgi:hypothetical protein